MTEAEIEAELVKMSRLFHMMAAEQTTPALRDDAYQECMIAAWQALAAGKPPGLVRADARRAAINVDRGRSMTGNKRKPGINGVDTHQRYGTPLVAVHDDGEEYLVVEPVVESPEDLFLAIEAVRERMAA